MVVIDPEDAGSECGILCFDLSNWQLASQLAFDNSGTLNSIRSYEGKIMAWDTYNGKVIVIDPEGGSVD